MEKPYNVMSRDVGGFFNFTQPPGAVEGVIHGQRDQGETGSINIGGYETVRSREVAFARSTGDLTRCCINMKLLIIPCIGRALVWTGRPIGKEFGTEGLKIRFASPRGANDTFPVSFKEDCNCTASTASTLMTCDFGDIDQDRRDGDVIGSDVIRRRLCRLGVKDILRKAGRKIPRHVIGIVRVDARLVTCHSDAGFCCRPR